MTGYVVLYYDGSVTRNQTAPATATIAIITVDPHTLKHTLSVMALSDEPFHLPGRSVWKIIELCELNLKLEKLNTYFSHIRESRECDNSCIKE